jgi:hypothetical protein
MMGGWTNQGITQLIIPDSAGAGDPQIGIGVDLPPPLDTYQPIGPGSRYVGGLLFFPQGPGGNDIDFLLMAHDPANPSFVRIDLGSVRGGVVTEFTAGTPMVQRWESIVGSDAYRFWGNAFAVNGLAGITLENELFGNISRIILGAGIDMFVDPGNNVSIDAEGLSVTGYVQAVNGGLIATGGDSTIRGDYLSLRNKSAFGFGANGSRNVNTYANYPGSPAVTITKLGSAAQTDLMVDWRPTYFVDNTNTGVDFAVAIGGTDYRTHVVAANMPAANARLSSSGRRRITGIAAGNRTITGRWARFDGVGQVQTTVNDYWTLVVEEVAVEV